MRKFGVQLYSVRDEFRKDMWGTLRKVKAMGYDAVEFFWEFTHTAQEIKAALKDTGLQCCGWHTPWHYLQPGNLMGTITYNKIIGNAELTVPGLPGEMTGSKAAWLETAKLFNDVAAKLAPYGMRLSYHNHGEEFKTMEGDLPIRHLMDNTCPCIGLQLDNGNAFSAGADTDVYDPITRYPGRVRTIHHKPYSVEKGFATMIGEDDIDWARFFALCDKHQNVDWHIVEYEDEKYSQLEGIEICLKALRKLSV
ncbi:MAG: sugar phosphate isomerase/epimerase [Defluviitaleaceae bacterium]|nr:sugar phosphate isomerase/epimerase [Defluviitaleaceae bacterium]